MISSVLKLLKLPFVSNVLTRLSNRYTAHGITIVLLQLQALGILPEGTSQAVDGLPTGELVGWLVIAIGIYFVFKKHTTTAQQLLEKVEAVKAQQQLIIEQRKLQALKEESYDNRHKD